MSLPKSLSKFLSKSFKLSDVANNYCELRKVIASLHDLGFDLCESYHYGKILPSEYKLSYDELFVLNVLSHLKPDSSDYRKILSLLRDMSINYCPFNLFLHAFGFVVDADIHVSIKIEVFSDFIELPKPPVWFMLDLTSAFVDEVSFRKGFFWWDSMYEQLEAMHSTVINGERLFTLFEKFFEENQHPTIYGRYCSATVSHKYHKKYENSTPVALIIRPDFVHGMIAEDVLNTITRHFEEFTPAPIDSLEQARRLIRAAGVVDIEIKSNASHALRYVNLITACNNNLSINQILAICNDLMQYKKGEPSYIIYILLSKFGFQHPYKFNVALFIKEYFVRTFNIDDAVFVISKILDISDWDEPLNDPAFYVLRCMCAVNGTLVQFDGDLLSQVFYQVFNVSELINDMYYRNGVEHTIVRTCSDNLKELFDGEFDGKLIHSHTRRNNIIAYIDVLKNFEVAGTSLYDLVINSDPNNYFITKGKADICT
jgi:hypothetical protein